jgi:subtilisin family serine protease
VTGVAWRTALLPVKALGDDGSGSASNIIKAYGYAVRSGARIVNLSLGGDQTSRAEIDAIASAPNVLFVAAAGNDAADNETTPSYPCNHALANVICVAASDRSDGLATFSNYGSTTVDLAAPGVAIVSTWPGNDYRLLGGTSMATPHVAGAAALLLARAPAASVGDLRRALLESVDRREGLARRTVTGGRLNVAAAIGALDALTGRQTSGGGPVADSPAEPAQPSQPTPAPESAPAPAPQPTTTPAQPASAPPMPVPAPRDATAPMLQITPSPGSSLRTLLSRRAVRVAVRCSERCALRLELRRGTTRVVRATGSVPRQGSTTVTLRLRPPSCDACGACGVRCG